MQIARMLQAVVLMLIVALAASCAATKQYSSKLFPGKDAEIKDSSGYALRFLLIDSATKDDENWVTTDIITERDTLNGTAALDILAKNLPANQLQKDSVLKAKDSNNNGPILVKNDLPAESGAPVAKTRIPNGVRTKKTRD
jgi:hypothetical protein